MLWLLVRIYEKWISVGGVYYNISLTIIIIYSSLKFLYAYIYENCIVSSYNNIVFPI